MHGPIPSGVAVTQVGLADKLAVRNIDEIDWNGHADIHAFDLIVPLILVRPPHQGTWAFARAVDPGMAGRVIFKRETAEPTGLLRCAGVIEVDAHGASSF